MLAAPLRKRIVSLSGQLASVARSYTSNGKSKGTGRENQTITKRIPVNGPSARKTQENEYASAPALSLVEQLFPEEEARWGSNLKKDQDGELPRVPLEQSTSRVPHVTRRQAGQTKSEKSATARLAENEMRAQGMVTSVLVLRNASKNLLDDDFRRIIPQGQQMEGWNLKEGDIKFVVPERDMVTLAPTGHYYIFFNSPLSAFSYQGHASRIHALAASQTPKSLLSPIAPPPGYQVDGMDAHAAIQAYSLMPPSQILELRKLQPPLTPVMQGILECAGYPHLVRRKGRMPFEARLTLSGTQIGRVEIEERINFEGRRGLNGWIAEDGHATPIMEWIPPDLAFTPSALDRSRDAQQQVDRVVLHGERGADVVMHGDTADLLLRADYDEAGDLRNQRSPSGVGGRPGTPVYIVGFHAERAMQSFVRHWHRRAIAFDQETFSNAPRDRRKDGIEYYEAPVANVEVLW